MLFRSAKKAGKEYGRLIKKCQKAVFVLDYARTCAYRNVYLGVELINLIRMSTGGGSLDTVQMTSSPLVDDSYDHCHNNVIFMSVKLQCRVLPNTDSVEQKDVFIC